MFVGLSGIIIVADGAFEAAVKHYRSERWTLRQGIPVFRFVSTNPEWMRVEVAGRSAAAR